MAVVPGHFYFDEEGKPCRAAGIVVDISERRSLIEAHRRAEERLELVLRGSNDAAWDLDLLTGQPYYSPRWLHRRRVAAFYESMLRGSDTTYELEFRLCHRNGHAVPVLSRGFVLRAADASRFLGSAGADRIHCWLNELG